MKIYRNIAIILLIIITILVVAGCLLYNHSLTAMSNDDTPIIVTIESGSGGAEIGKILKENKLIRNVDIFKFYLKLNKINNLKSGKYEFNQTMDVKEIVDILVKGSSYNEDNITITFPEGKNIRGIAKIIESKTNNTADDVFNLLNNTDYIDSLIEEYWFLEREIKNETIYYPLEGYLFPETYQFSGEDVSVKEIFKIMLNQTDKILKKYKNDIAETDFTIHEFLTMASIVESEGVSKNDRDKIASVFLNRLDKFMPLESCVTSYYAAKIDMNERDLYTTEYKAKNPYNTRGPEMDGKLPVGPISNPGEESIKAVLAPDPTDFLFFVADKNYDTYFTKTYDEHLKKIADLKAKNMWKEW